MSKQVVAFFLAALVLFASCESVTLIQSDPSGAGLYVNGAYRGVTPYSYADEKIIHTDTYFTLRKEGYEDLNFVLSRNEEIETGPFYGGFLTMGFLWLWVLGYEDTHSYVLTPATPSGTTDPTAPNASQPKDVHEQVEAKAAALRELKKLYDEGILSPEEYEQEKAKILEGEQ